MNRVHLLCAICTLSSWGCDDETPSSDDGPANGGAAAAGGVTGAGDPPAGMGGEAAGMGGDSSGMGGEPTGMVAPPSGTPPANPACADLWNGVDETFIECEGAAAVVAWSLMDLTGVTIDNEGQTWSPCVEARCTADEILVAANALPHYDFVPTTPNALVMADTVYRIPARPSLVDQEGAVTADSLLGCEDALAQYARAPNQATNNEPSGLCIQNGNAQVAYDELMDGSRFYWQQLPCLGYAGFLTNGSPYFGPNEGPMPDPWGNPLFAGPNVAGEPENDLRGGAVLDMCGGHTAFSMHYHGVNEACFAMDENRHPTASYAEAAQTWSLDTWLNDACESASPIVGWNADGYPIKGSCICVERGADGRCTVLKRARSSWAYQGLHSHGERPDTLAVEGNACSGHEDCCTDNNCDFRCTYSVFDAPQADGGTVAEKRCVLLDYAWCTHQYIDRSVADVADTHFAYLDRCNGYEGPDGYAYHATGSFPYIAACYRGAPTASAGGGMGMGPGGMRPGGMGRPGMGGMNGMLPSCEELGRRDRCCGDGMCRGPETPENCPADC